MSTINISLPQKQVTFIDSLVAKYGFANRSEFMRSILRLVQYKPHVIQEATTFPFEAPKLRSRSKILAGMGRTGKYSEAFLRSLEEGMKDSDYFTP